MVRATKVSGPSYQRTLLQNLSSNTLDEVLIDDDEVCQWEADIALAYARLLRQGPLKPQRRAKAGKIATSSGKTHPPICQRSNPKFLATWLRG